MPVLMRWTGGGQARTLRTAEWANTPSPLQPAIRPHATARLPERKCAAPVRGRRYRGAMDVKRAADLYAQGWTLRQIADELGLTETTVSDQLRRAGVTMRRSGPPAHPASTDQIMELRDRGLTWSEVAERVDMTVSGAWSRYLEGAAAQAAALARLAARRRP